MGGYCSIPKIKNSNTHLHKLWESDTFFYILWICAFFFSHPKLHVTKWLFKITNAAVTLLERFSIMNKSEKDKKEPAPTTMIISMSSLLLSLINDGNTHQMDAPLIATTIGTRNRFFKVWHWTKDTITGGVSLTMCFWQWQSLPGISDTNVTTTRLW